METIQEVFEKCGVVKDSKARRVLNTAPNQNSGITLKEIEAGVTIEKLESLEVPVYLYGGQVTIHGVFSDDIGNLRVAGYKSVFKNGNGSMGVKYVAIDGAKKELLSKISHLSDSGNWYVSLNSSGADAHKSFKTKEEAIACLRSAPDMFVGSKWAGVTIYGSYVVVLEIGAIYEKDFWTLTEALTGLNEATYLQKQEAKDKQSAEDNAKWEAEYAVIKAKKEEIAKINEAYRIEAAEKLATKFKKASAVGVGTYVYPFASNLDGRKGFMVIKLTKGGFGRLLEQHKFFSSIEEIADFELVGKSKVIDAETLQKKLLFKVV